jgi:hypothetical protein
MSLYERGPFLVGSMGSSYFLSSPVTISLHLSPLPWQARQAPVLGHLSLNKCLCSHLIIVVMMNVSRRLSEELANVSVPVQQTASRVGTETGLVRVQRDRVRAATERALKVLSNVTGEGGCEWYQLIGL